MMASAGLVIRDEAVRVTHVKAWLGPVWRPPSHGPVLNLLNAAASTFGPQSWRVCWQCAGPALGVEGH